MDAPCFIHYSHLKGLEYMARHPSQVLIFPQSGWREIQRHRVRCGKNRDLVTIPEFSFTVRSLHWRLGERQRQVRGISAAPGNPPSSSRFLQSTRYPRGKEGILVSNEFIGRFASLFGL